MDTLPFKPPGSAKGFSAGPSGSANGLAAMVSPLPTGSIAGLTVLAIESRSEDVIEEAEEDE